MSSKKGGDRGKVKGAADGGDADATQAEIKRIAEIIAEASKRAPAQVAPYVKQFAPYLATAWVYFLVVLPYIITAFKKVNEFVSMLPEKIIYAALGFAICFCGGIFPATIAAVEAWSMCGGHESYESAKVLVGELRKVADANQKDEDKQSTKQLTPQELIVHKAQLVLKNVEPERVSAGVVGLYTGWIGVLAILKIEFARTVTLGAKIGEQLHKPVEKFEPQIAEMLPEEYRKWVPVATRYTCKAIAITIAWWIQRVISAFHSAIRGGHLFGKYLVEFLHEKGILKSSADQVYLDEAIGWALAAAGLLFQFSMGFRAPFPLNLLLLPVQFVEGFIVWSVGN